MIKLSTSFLFIASFILGVVVCVIYSSYTNKRSQITIPILLPMPSATSVPPTITSTPVPTLVSDKYPLKTHIFATMFWVGEKATDENDYIPNKASAWDKDWLDHYGGVDTPYDRSGFSPKSFTPKENPFYFALPYTDLRSGGSKKANATKIAWYDSQVTSTVSLVKNRWIKVVYKNKTCYGQWEDVGPFEDDDFDYVFGTAAPLEKRAGIDLSPAMRTCLHMNTNGYVDWKFMEEEDVPDGPWKETITASQINW